MYQPYYPGYINQNPLLQQQNSLIRVTGIDGAKAYQMQPNSTAALFDANDDYLYIKSTDGAGFPTIRTFRFEELTQAPAPAAGDYISRKEFDDFKMEVMNYAKQLIQPTAGNGKSKQSSKSNESD